MSPSANVGGPGQICSFRPANSSQPTASAPISVIFTTAPQSSLTQVRAQFAERPSDSCNGAPQACDGWRNEPQFGSDAFEYWVIRGRSDGVCDLAFAADGKTFSMQTYIYAGGGAQYGVSASDATLCGWAQRLAADT